LGNAFSCLIGDALTVLPMTLILRILYLTIIIYALMQFFHQFYGLVNLQRNLERPIGQNHSTDNSQFYTSHPSINEVINIIVDIQSETYLKIKSFKENRINKLRKEKENKLKFIMQIWTTLEQNEIHTI